MTSQGWPPYGAAPPGIRPGMVRRLRGSPPGAVVEPFRSAVRLAVRDKRGWSPSVRQSG